MENINEMRKRHENEIKELQNLCPHHKLSGWVTEYWAITHGTGNLIKVCEFCGKVVERKGMIDWIQK